MFFWNSLAFSMIQQVFAIWSLVPLPFRNPDLEKFYPNLSQGRQNENHNHRKLTKLITKITALSDSMKLYEPWSVESPKMDGSCEPCHVGPPKMVGHSGEFWQNFTGPLKKGMANHVSILALWTQMTDGVGILSCAYWSIVYRFWIKNSFSPSSSFPIFSCVAYNFVIELLVWLVIDIWNYSGLSFY